MRINVAQISLATLARNPFLPTIRINKKSLHVGTGSIRCYARLPALHGTISKKTSLFLSVITFFSRSFPLCHNFQTKIAPPERAPLVSFFQSGTIKRHNMRRNNLIFNFQSCFRSLPLVAVVPFEVIIKHIVSCLLHRS